MTQSPSADEAAAIAAAIERFRTETAPVVAVEAIGPWQWAALVEGVSAKATVEDPEGGVRWR